MFTFFTSEFGEGNEAEIKTFFKAVNWLSFLLFKQFTRRNAKMFCN
jgi:hypothetical protein